MTNKTVLFYYRLNPDVELTFGRWHISAIRYEIAIAIISENYRDKTNIPGNTIYILYKKNLIKISQNV